MHYSLIEKVCAANYPILVGIVKNLSSTDTSAFLYATGLWRLVGDGFMKRFMTIERELSFISGCGEWIDDLRERGDTVLVVGDAVNILMNRYNRLVSYWTDVKNGIITSNCKVWIIGVSRVGYVVTRLDAHRSVYGVDLAEVDNYKMSESGEIVRLDGPGRACPGGCHGSICKSLLPVGTPLLPGPGKWPRCVTDWILEADIYSPNISVMNNGGFSVYCIQDTTSDGIDTTIYTNSQYIDVSGSLPTSRDQDLLQAVYRPVVGDDIVWF
ncbi:hypothetical protein NW754_011201 [Fusarium falciforme]|nr:hypothetical protein NW754_011201 [Fusarium falciforme]